MTWHAIPNTPEIRASLEQTKQETIAALGLNPSQLEPWEDGRRSKDDATTFEWWYFDVQLDDGSTLVLTYGNKSPTDAHGAEAPIMLAIRQQPDGSSVKHTIGYDVSEYSASAEQCDVRLGPNWAKGDLNRYAAHVEVDGLTADVTIDRIAPSWRSGAGVSYVDAAKRKFFGWFVAVPYGTATVVITKDGQTKELTGSAYHDHNWGNASMQDITNHWFWGRAHLGDYALIYAMVFTQGFLGIGQLQAPTIYLAKGDRILVEDWLPLSLTIEGEVEGPLHSVYPTRLDWVWQDESRGRIAFTSTEPRLIESLDMRPPRHGMSQLLHAHEHASYLDFNADFELTIDLDGVQDHVTGRTLYEKMTLR